MINEIASLLIKLSEIDTICRWSFTVDVPMEDVEMYMSVGIGTNPT